MPQKRIIGVELSHHNAPISIREKVALNKEQTKDLLEEIKASIEEVFIISTCNRLAIYAFDDDYQQVLDVFARFGNLSRYLSVFSDTKLAITHLFSTAAGLESQAIGEHQIIGQIRDGYELSESAGSLGVYLSELARKAIHTGKRVRHETSIGKHSTSLATVGFDVISQKYDNLKEVSVLVVGTGHMANLVSTVLERTDIKKVYVASHDFDRAEKVGKEWGAEPVLMQDIFDILPDVEIIVGGTQAEVNLLSEAELTESKCPRANLALNTGEPKLIIDFGMPRNFNPILKDVDNVTLYDLDDLKKLTYESMLKRENEIPKAEAIIYEELDKFIEWMDMRSISPLLTAYWNQLETIRDEEIDWLLPKLGELTEQQENLIRKFSHRLIRSISHQPFKNMKKVAQNKHIKEAPVHTVKSLLSLDDVNIFVPKKKIIVGSRGSKLAITQTNMVIRDLQALEPEYEFELKIIRTRGDEGKIDEVGAFTKGIQKALLNKEIDLAVHSLKDMPTEVVPGLIIGATPQRVDHRDVLISNNKKGIMEQEVGAVIGTGSLRRQIQIQQMRPDLKVEFIQGNVDGRIKQMEEGKYDAIILAAAGLKRMGLIEKAHQIFTNEEMLPAVNQGILGIEMRDESGTVADLLERYNDVFTRFIADAERAFLKTLGGGCNEPYAAFAEVDEEGIMTIHGMYAAKDGEGYTTGVTSGPVCHGMAMGEQLAKQLINSRKLNEVG